MLELIIFGKLRIIFQGNGVCSKARYGDRESIEVCVLCLAIESLTS